MGESVTGASGCYGEAPELGLMFPGSPAVLDQILNQADAAEPLPSANAPERDRGLVDRLKRWHAKGSARQGLGPVSDNRGEHNSPCMAP